MRIFKFASALFFGTVILYHSGKREQFGVGRIITLPNSLSSNATIFFTSAYNLTLTVGNGCFVVKSPCVSQLKKNYNTFKL